MFSEEFPRTAGVRLGLGMNKLGEKRVGVIGASDNIIASRNKNFIEYFFFHRAPFS